MRSGPPGGRARWLTILPPDLAVPLSASVAALAPAIEHALSPDVVANRWDPASADLLEPAASGRARLRRRLATIGPLGRGSTIVRSDVFACYPSIGIAAVAAVLPPGDARELLLRTLRRIHGRGGVGLPVGPAASAIVANAVLAGGDRAIAATGARHLRWVDDVAIVADDPGQARRAFQAWRGELERVGLTVNLAKTAIDVDPRELPRWIGSDWGAPAGVR